jgi:hypothetical protein
MKPKVKMKIVFILNNRDQKINYKTYNIEK